MFSGLKSYFCFFSKTSHSNMFQIRMILQLSVIDMTKEAQFNYTDNMQATLISSYFYGYVSIMVRSHN